MQAEHGHKADKCGKSESQSSVTGQKDIPNCQSSSGVGVRGPSAEGKLAGGDRVPQFGLKIDPELLCWAGRAGLLSVHTPARHLTGPKKL